MDVMNIRLDKYLADMGVGTRSAVKDFIRKKRIRVNDALVTNPAFKVDTGRDEVYFDDDKVNYAEYEYYIINKPAGVICATTDSHQPTVIDLIKSSRKDLFTVGRLDKDTEGLLIITNDGALTHNLLAPGKHVDKKYFLRVDGELRASHADLIAAGLKVSDDFTARPGKLEILSPNEAYLTICEGKFHQVKRMMEALGCTVTYLKRVQMGGLSLPAELECGMYRALTESELDILRGNDA